MKKSQQRISPSDFFFQLPRRLTRPRRRPVRFVLGEKLRQLRLLQRLTPQEWRSRPHDLSLEPLIVHARRQKLTLKQFLTEIMEAATALTEDFRLRYENGDRQALAELIAAERPDEPWLIDAEWYKAGILAELFAVRPLSLVGKGNLQKLSPDAARKSKRESTKKSKQKYDAEVKKAVSRLEPAVLAARMQGKSSPWLLSALQSDNAPTRRAAHIVQEKIQQGKL